jgi:hypothetical protein
LVLEAIISLTAATPLEYSSLDVAVIREQNSPNQLAGGDHFGRLPTFSFQKKFKVFFISQLRNMRRVKLTSP